LTQKFALLSIKKIRNIYKIAETYFMAFMVKIIMNYIVFSFYDRLSFEDRTEAPDIVIKALEVLQHQNSDDEKTLVRYNVSTTDNGEMLVQVQHNDLEALFQ